MNSSVSCGDFDGEAERGDGMGNGGVERGGAPLKLSPMRRGDR